jgi:glucuronate isomerase
MRSNGVAEKFVTGEASPHEKFLAWAKTVPHTLRNPLYHWTHLELKRYFGITNCSMKNPPRKSGRRRMKNSPRPRSRRTAS